VKNTYIGRCLYSSTQGLLRCGISTRSMSQMGQNRVDDTGKIVQETRVASERCASPSDAWGRLTRTSRSSSVAVRCKRFRAAFLFSSGCPCA